MSRRRVARLASDNLVMTAQRGGMPPGPAPKGGVKLTREQMTARDERILRLFIGGATEREIAQHVGLTGVRIHQILERELEATARHRLLLRSEALTVHLARLETLIKAVWPKAIQGDLKAVDIARRVLAQEAAVLGVRQGAGAVPAPADVEFDPDDVVDQDELARFRRAHRRRGDS